LLPDAPFTEDTDLQTMVEMGLFDVSGVQETHMNVSPLFGFFFFS
jgi:hypothetical protein